ncbi:hypothetical protein Hdeb2414_s0010g00333581 [Helianthus debilis subsp. tardiflorus]
MPSFGITFTGFNKININFKYVYLLVIQGVVALSLLWFWDPTFQLELKKVTFEYDYLLVIQGVAALSLLRFWDHIFQLG